MIIVVTFIRHLDVNVPLSSRFLTARLDISQKEVQCGVGHLNTVNLANTLSNVCLIDV